MTRGKAAQHTETAQTEEHGAAGGTGSERSYLAACHNESNSEEARMHAAQEYCKLHKERTGEKLDPREVMDAGAKTHRHH